MLEKEIEKQLLEQINLNDQGSVWITDKLSYNTKVLVQQAKRSYYGQYTNLTDDNEIYWPLSKSHVDVITSNIDYDVSDISVVSETQGYKSTAYLLSEVLRKNLKDFQFGKLMNEAAHQLVRDGSVVIRTFEQDGDPKSEVVDLENLWTDFQTNEPKWFCERISIPKSQVPDSWNLKDIPDSSTAFENSGDKRRNEVVAYRYEGWMPRGWINNTNDKEQIYGLLWITGIRGGGKFKVQSRKILKEPSYDWCQFTPNSARFIGVGVPESLYELQKYYNLVINNRVKKGNMVAKGLLLVRKGSGITPDILEMMQNNGAINVTNIDSDIKQLPVQDSTGSSFNEEMAIKQMANELTGATEISRGQVQRSGVTLGQSNLEASFSSIRFQYHKEALGFMFESILNKWMDMIVKNLDEETVLKITDKSVLSELSEKQAKIDKERMKQKANDMFGYRGEMSVEQLPVETFYKERFNQNEWKLIKSGLSDLDYKVNISINNEIVDKNTIAQNIVQSFQFLQAMPNGQEIAAPMIEKLFEILNIPSASFKKIS